jgi:hypothetical protein
MNSKRSFGLAATRTEPRLQPNGKRACGSNGSECESEREALTELPWLASGSDGASPSPDDSMLLFREPALR